MTPLKKQEKKDSNKPDNTKETVENKEKDDALQKNKTEDKDDTNVIWERKKKIFSKKQDMINVLCPYVDNDQMSDEEYKEFANFFLTKVWDLQDIYET